MLNFLKHPGTALSAIMEKRLTGNLRLDTNQRQQIHEYFEENLQQRKELQKQIHPQVMALNQQLMQQINGILRPDQAELFRQNLDRFNKRLAANVFSNGADHPPAATIQPISGAPTNTSTTNSAPSH
jgi:hypothetical protein